MQESICTFFVCNVKSRKRPKSATYLRLKNSKRTSKCQVFSFTTPEKFFEKSQWRKNLKRGTLWDFSTSILSQNSEKIEGGPFGEFFSGKKSQCRKNWKGGPFGFFKPPFYRKTSKNERDPLVKNDFWNKSRTMPKKTGRGNPLVSPGIVCYAEKKEETFLVQFARPNGSI